MKNQYHSDFILQYKLGLLPKNIVKKIPPTTTHYWRNTPNNNFFAPDVLYAQEQNMTLVKEFLSRKELLRAAKAMYHIFL